MCKFEENEVREFRYIFYISDKTSLNGVNILLTFDVIHLIKGALK